MVTFKNNSNNNRRANFRRTDRGFKNNSFEKNKFNTQFGNNDKFQRKNSSRNNQNAFKLFEKYNNLAREALSTGDKILSESYFQHADHFKRILNDQEKIKKDKEKNFENTKDENGEDIVVKISTIEENQQNISENTSKLQQESN